MSGAVLAAVVAAAGSFLQGWDNATIAGAILYIKQEFKLESDPTIEGLIVAMSLIGAACVTTCSGFIADWLGRRPLLIVSSILYFISSLVMIWSPNVPVLLLGRLLNGFGAGLVVTLVPVYISEIAPPEMRGLLNTLPQFTGSFGMFFSYCMVFGMSLMRSPSWRLMLGVLSIPSLICFVLTLLFLPESPHWLVSKGRMAEAKKVLQRLRGRENVAGEVALFVEGLGVGGEASIEEYIISPETDDNGDLDISEDKDQIKLYGPEPGLSWVARPITRQSAIGHTSRLGNMATQNVPLMDGFVTLFRRIHEKALETGSMRSALFPHFGSMFSVGGNQARDEEWDEESVAREDEEYQPEGAADDSDDNLHSPLISRQTTTFEKDMPPAAHGTFVDTRFGGIGQGGEPDSSTGIGGGWQLTWKLPKREGPSGEKNGGFKRIYLHKEAVPGTGCGSAISLPGGDAASATDNQFIRAAGLVGQPALYSKELMKEHPIGPAMLHPSEVASKGPSWANFFKPGVRHALIVGLAIQILQQLSGINGVLYYTPQILERAGVGVLFTHMEISSVSISLLVSGIITLLMLPSIAVGMRLMDFSGRRSLLLITIPVLMLALIIVIIGNVVAVGKVVYAALSTVSVILYLCFFVLGFGPIPNIVCAEIFPTRVRGICFSICALAFWIGNIIVTYSLPFLLKSVGLAGVFGMYAIVCFISWVFVFLKVPETKCMPLEVIAELFSVGATEVTAEDD